MYLKDSNYFQIKNEYLKFLKKEKLKEKRL